MGAEEVEGAPKAAPLPPASTSVMGVARCKIPSSPFVEGQRDQEVIYLM
jgi:hypothetical protein